MKQKANDTADDSERATFCPVDKHRIYKTSLLASRPSSPSSAPHERLDIDNLKADRKLLAVIFITMVHDAQPLSSFPLFSLFFNAQVLSIPAPRHHLGYLKDLHYMYDCL